MLYLFLLFTLVVFVASAVIPRRVVGFRNAVWLRAGLMYLPFVLPAAAGYSWAFGALSLVDGLAAAGIAILALSLQIRDITALLHPDMMDLQGPLPLTKFVVLSWSAVGAAIFEELFFRGYAISVLRESILFWSIPVSAALFVGMHFVNPGARQYLTVRGVAGIAILGLGFGALYYYSGDLWPCIIAHGLYNGPRLVNYVVRGFKGLQRPQDA